MSRTPEHDRLSQLHAAGKISNQELDELRAAIERIDAAPQGRSTAHQRLVEQLLNGEISAAQFFYQVSDDGEAPLPTIPRRKPIEREPPQPGEILAYRFRLLEPVGEGAMGICWLAEDFEIRDGERVVLRNVCIKVLPPMLQADRSELRRFDKIFGQVHGLQHPNLCPVYLLETDQRYGRFLVMKYIKGMTLNEYRDAYVDKHGTFPLEEVARILKPVAEALDYIHSQDLLHRDIKPANLLISDDGSDIQIVDLGLVAAIHSSLTRVSKEPRDRAGTAAYMAPEQWLGQRLTGAADQYALAVVAYELIAGDLPFDCDNDIAWAHSAIHGPVPPVVSQTDAVNAALQQGLAKQPGQRFGTCTEFRAVLAGESEQSAASNEPDPLLPPEPEEMRTLAAKVRDEERKLLMFVSHEPEGHSILRAAFAENPPAGTASTIKRLSELPSSAKLRLDEIKDTLDYRHHFKKEFLDAERRHLDTVIQHMLDDPEHAASTSSLLFAKYERSLTARFPGWSRNVILKHFESKHREWTESGWPRVRNSDDVSQLEKFAKRFPNSRYCLTARERIAEHERLVAERKAQKEEETRQQERRAKEEATRKAKTQAAARRQERAGHIIGHGFIGAIIVGVSGLFSGWIGWATAFASAVLLALAIMYCIPFYAIPCALLGAICGRKGAIVGAIIGCTIAVIIGIFMFFGFASQGIPLSMFGLDSEMKVQTWIEASVWQWDTLEGVVGGAIIGAVGGVLIGISTADK